MKADLFKTVLSVALAGLCTYLANLTVPILVLVGFMVLDWITGLTAAWVHGELNSRVGIIGIVKKVCYIVTICVAMGADYLIYSALEQIGVEHHLSYMVGMVVTIWLNINELISILENVAKITGKNSPSMLLKLLERLKDGVEHRSDDEDGKH